MLNSSRPLSSEGACGVWEEVAREISTHDPHVGRPAPRHAPGTRDPPPVCEIIGPGLATAFFPFSALMSALQFVRLFIAFIDHKAAYLYTRDTHVRRVAYVVSSSTVQWRSLFTVY